ncbi:MAG: ABC transporter permease subunit [Deltaproteobacteria bacterium]|jgi:multiple sugar transport system permease protein|nr:ABC transporter permease subunit [Deltaproteobacteria bacterium]
MTSALQPDADLTPADPAPDGRKPQNPATEDPTAEDPTTEDPAGASLTAQGPASEADLRPAAPPSVASRPPKAQRKPRVQGRFFTVPGQIVSLVVLIMPLLVALYMSFTDWSPTRSSLRDAAFTGLDNYKELLVYDDRFVEAVLRTLFLAVTSLSLEFVLGLTLAVLFLRTFRGKRFLFSAFLTPMMVLPVVVGYTFWMLFQANGPINQILHLIGLAGVEWLKSSNLAFAAVVVTEVWHWTPLFFLILLSGLNSVPENPVRAAVILGASPRQVFWKVVFPMLRPVVAVAFVVRAMEVVKIFDEVFLLTRGGPGSSTETVSLYIYKLAFNDFQLAYGAAAAFLTLTGSLIMVHLLLTPVRDQLMENGR